MANFSRGIVYNILILKTKSKMSTYFFSDLSRFVSFGLLLKLYVLKANLRRKVGLNRARIFRGKTAKTSGYSFEID